MLRRLCKPLENFNQGQIQSWEILKTVKKNKLLKSGAGGFKDLTLISTLKSGYN